MVHFSDTWAMTKTVLRRNPSIAVYPLLAMIGGHGLKLGGILLPMTDNPFLAVIGILFLGVGVIVGLTSFTYPMFRIGYVIANELGRPTHLHWNSWSASFGLTIPWVAALAFHLAIGLLLSFCFVLPTFIYFILAWPIFPLIFGPRFDMATSFSLTKEMLSKATIWVVCLGVLILVGVGAALFALMFVGPLVNVFFFSKGSTTAIWVAHYSGSIVLNGILVLALIYLTVVVLMIAEDIHEPCFNVKSPTAPRLPADLYDENAATVALAAVQVSPDVAAKIQQLADLRAKGILSEAEFLRERAALRR